MATRQPEGVVSECAQVTELLQVGAQCCDARLLEPDPAHQRDWRILGDTTLADECRKAVVPRRQAKPSPA